MSDFNATYPEYAATARLDKLRATEYCYLNEGGHVYLDYTGAGLAAPGPGLALTTPSGGGPGPAHPLARRSALGPGVV